MTHPEATRYFMTITEACQLILQAAALGEQRAMYALDMGAPVEILALARRMLRQAGLRPAQIGWVFTGLRPGERLHEPGLPTPRWRAAAGIWRLALDVAAADAVQAMLPMLERAVRAYDLPALQRLMHDAMVQYQRLDEGIVACPAASTAASTSTPE